MSCKIVVNGVSFTNLSQATEFADHLERCEVTPRISYLRTPDVETPAMEGEGSPEATDDNPPETESLWMAIGPVFPRILPQTSDSAPPARGRLVLAREVGETIRIGDCIDVTVSRIGRDKVRLLVEAPLDVPVVRGELLLGPIHKHPTKKG